MQLAGHAHLGCHLRVDLSKNGCDDKSTTSHLLVNTWNPLLINNVHCDEQEEDSVVFLSTLTRAQAAAVERRVVSLQTLKRRNRQHAPDVRDIFRAPETQTPTKACMAGRGQGRPTRQPRWLRKLTLSQMSVFANFRVTLTSS